MSSTDGTGQFSAHDSALTRDNLEAPESSDGLRLRTPAPRQDATAPLQAVIGAVDEAYATGSASSSAAPKEWNAAWAPAAPHQTAPNPGPTAPPMPELHNDYQPPPKPRTAETSTGGGAISSTASVAVTTVDTPNGSPPNSIPAADPARIASGKAPRNNPVAFTPAVILDGSKLILRLAKNARFTLDSPCKVLLSTPNVRLDKMGCWQTSGVCAEPENTIVIDSGSPGLRFVPIPLNHFGTIYTKDSVAHVTIGNAIQRSKVHSRNMPYRTCNKFSTLFMPNDIGSSGSADEQDDSVANWLVRRQATTRALGSIDPEQAAGLIKSMAADPQVGTVFIRADDSIIRYRLRHDEAIDLHSGRIVAWSLGVRFEQTNTCCLRFVTAIRGEGTVWISSSARAPSQATGF